MNKDKKMDIKHIQSRASGYVEYSHREATGIYSAAFQQLSKVKPKNLEDAILAEFLIAYKFKEELVEAFLDSKHRAKEYNQHWFFHIKNPKNSTFRGDNHSIGKYFSAYFDLSEQWELVPGVHIAWTDKIFPGASHDPYHNFLTSEQPFYDRRQEVEKIPRNTAVNIQTYEAYKNKYSLASQLKKAVDFFNNSANTYLEHIGVHSFRLPGHYLTDHFDAVVANEWGHEFLQWLAQNDKKQADQLRRGIFATGETFEGLYLYRLDKPMGKAQFCKEYLMVKDEYIERYDKTKETPTRRWFRSECNAGFWKDTLQTKYAEWKQTRQEAPKKVQKTETPPPPAATMPLPLKISETAQEERFLEKLTHGKWKYLDFSRELSKRAERKRNLSDYEWLDLSTGAKFAGGGDNLKEALLNTALAMKAHSLKSAWMYRHSYTQDAGSYKMTIHTWDFETLWNVGKEMYWVQYDEYNKAGDKFRFMVAPVIEVWPERTTNPGLSHGKSVADIARMHGVSKKVLERQLRLGIAEEMEHTDDPRVAKRISMDHLVEHPDYYDRLKKAGL